VKFVVLNSQCKMGMVQVKFVELRFFASSRITYIGAWIQPQEQVNTSTLVLTASFLYVIM